MRRLPVVPTLRAMRWSPSRIGPAALVALAHVAALFALLHPVGKIPARDHVAPNRLMVFAFIQAPPSRPQAPPQVAPVVALRSVRAARRQEVTVAMPVAIEQEGEEAAPASPETPMPGPGLDMDALRAAARQVAAEQKPTAAAPLRAVDDGVLAQSVRKAKRPDCQTKYAGGEKANILLLIPLAIETIADKGCRW